MLFHNHAVTGDFTTLPYELSRYQYGVPTTLTFQDNPVPHAALTPAQRLYCEGQAAVHGTDSDTFGDYVERLLGRASFYRFFYPAALFLALPFALPLLRRFRYAWIALTLLLFALGTNFYAYFFPHYIAAIAGLLLLAALLGLQRLRQLWNGAGALAAGLILLLCGAHFLFFYGVHALGDAETLRAAGPYESAAGLNPRDPQGRTEINARLAQAPGRELVFVRYFSNHGYHESIHNAADIDRARVVYALELSPNENAKLKRYYPDRKVWLLEPDADPPRLMPYPASNGPFLSVE